MKILSIIFGTLLIALLLFMTVRLWGENQRYKPFDAPFFKGSSPALIVGWEQNFLLEKNPEIILWVDTYRAENENLLVKPWADRNRSAHQLEQTANPARPLLKDLLLKFPNSRFVINCNDNVHDIHRQLVQVIEESNATDRVMIQSDYNTILISSKELSPLIVYGSTIADLARLKTFESMFLLPVAPFKGDVFFSPLKVRNRTAVSKGIVLEMKRRFKKVFIGPISNQEELIKAREFEPDGLFVEDPFLVLEKP